MISLLSVYALATSMNFCLPEPVPTNMNELVWENYLNETLHLCFDELDWHVPRTLVVIEGKIENNEWDAQVGCEGAVCTIGVGRDLIKFLDGPEKVVFVLGHEAQHLAMSGENFPGLGLEEAEYAADMVGASYIPFGACYGAQVLGWLIDIIAPLPAFESRTVLATHRRKALLAQCVINR